jgi:hypothetical protein
VWLIVCVSHVAARFRCRTGIIDRALKSKDVFAFGELLDLPAVQAVRTSETQLGTWSHVSGS